MLYNAITAMTEYGGQIVIALFLFAAHHYSAPIATFYTNRNNTGNVAQTLWDYDPNSSGFESFYFLPHHRGRWVGGVGLVAVFHFNQLVYALRNVAMHKSVRSISTVFFHRKRNEECE